MGRILALHGVLALVASAAAYAAWSTPKSEDDNSITVVAQSADRLTEIAWSDKDADVLLQKNGDHTLVSITDKRAPKGEAAAAPPSKKSYPASERASGLFGRLAPLVAARKLGKVDAAQRKEFGLEEPSGHLTLRFGNDVAEIAVGDATYGGSGVYAESAVGDVYLLKQHLFVDLRNGASLLPERSLLPVERASVRRVVVTSANHTRELLHRDGAEENKAFWSDPAEPDAALALAKTWLQELWRLRMVDNATSAPSTPAAVEVELFGDKGSLGTVSLWQPGESTAVAQSSFFPSPVTVGKPSVEALLRDVGAMLDEKATAEH